jgi:hypothetical protein
MLAMVVLRQIGHGAISMPSHASDGAATQGCTGCDKVVQPRARSIKVLSQCEEVGLACQSLLIFTLTSSRVLTCKIS